MHPPVVVISSRLLSILGLARTVFVAAMVSSSLALSALAVDPPKSLLPAFGPTGREMTPKALTGHDIRGWLPKDWVDNSSWAPVSIIYSALPDLPEAHLGALRIEVTKLHSHHSQLTTKGGTQTFQKGVTYVVSGWVRSPSDTTVFAGFREDEEPRNFFEGGDLEVSPEWKRFTLEWTPAQNRDARLMFNVHRVGKVDLAGITLEAKR